MLEFIGFILFIGAFVCVVFAAFLFGIQCIHWRDK